MLNRVLRKKKPHWQVGNFRDLKVMKGPAMHAVEEFHVKGVINIKILIQKYASNYMRKKQGGLSDWSRWLKKKVGFDRNVWMSVCLHVYVGGGCSLCGSL